MRKLLAILLLSIIMTSVIAVHRKQTSLAALQEQEAKRDQRPYREVDLDLIRRAFCYNDHSEWGGVGTAWMIDKDTFVTAAHLIAGNSHCIDVDTEIEMKVVYVDYANDIAILRAPAEPQKNYLNYSCEGFRNEGHYISTGWADGTRFKQTHLRSTYGITAPDTVIQGKRGIGLRFLLGNIYQGMSGGPIFDDHGVAIGINTATDGQHGSFSRDLRDTILCQPVKRASLP